MIQAETNRRLLQCLTQALVTQKVMHPLQNLKRNLKLLQGCENLLLTILNWQQEISDLKVFLVKVVLVVCSRGGWNKMELLQSNLAQDLLLWLKFLIMMGFRVIKNGCFICDRLK